MADNLSLPASGVTVATKDLAGIHYQKFIATDSSGTEVLPLTDAQLRATAVPVTFSGSIAVTGGLTDTQLRATAVPVSGTVTANAGTGTFAVSAATLPLPSGAATAAKQPALGTAGTASADVVTVQGVASMTALKVDGSGVTQPVSIAGTVAVSGPLTDTQVRATALPVSGTVTSNAGTGTFAVSAASLPLPTGASTETTLSALNTKVTACNTGAVVVTSGTVTLGAGTALAGKVGIDQTTPGATNKVSIGTDGTVTLGAGSALAGKVGIDQTTPGTTNKVSIGSDGTITLLAGSAAIGKLAANSGVNIGDVGTVTAVTAITNAVTIKADTAGNQANALKVDGSAVTQPVSNAAGVSLGYATGKTTVLKTGTLASSATTADQVVLTYTVTALKTFYLEYIAWQARLTTFAATATNFGTISLETPSGTKVITHDVAHVGDTYPHVIQFAEPIPVAAGVVIRVVCTPSAVTAMTWRASFGGYEK